MVACPLLPWTTSSVAAVDSCHMHSLSPLAASDQVYRAGYFEFEVETNTATLELETFTAALELKTDTAPLELETEIGRVS
jgi:hypothetical protein